jgi:rfaE bifunctional protein kinase chain/domain
VLVIGDTIVDRYVACDPVGLSNEAPVVVVKEMQSRDYVGGAAIVAAHVVSLGGACTYLSVVGSDEPGSYVDKELAVLGVKSDLIQDDTRPTTFKLRYLVENQKLFRVSRLKEHNVSKVVENYLIDCIWKMAPDLTGVVVSDFVYGVITPRILEVLSQVAEKYNVLLFGDLQCSSQIGNVGKFVNFDLLSPTEREVRIALNNQDDGIEHIANLLIQ